jgi:hypothetical protein
LGEVGGARILLDIGVGEGQDADPLARLEARRVREQEEVPLVTPLAREREPRGLREALDVRGLKADPLEALEQCGWGRCTVSDDVDDGLELCHTRF